MNLSPTARWLLGGAVAALTAFSASLPLFTGVPDWLGPALAVVLATAGALGLVPPQVGGTQQGVVNPSVSEPPPADVEPSAGKAPTTFHPGTGANLMVAPLGLLLAADRVSSGEALFWIGVAVVVGCILGAIYLVVQYSRWVEALVLVVIAIVAAVLLL